LDLARAAMRNVTLAKAAQEFLEIVVKSVGGEAGTVYIYDEVQNDLLLAAHKGLGRKLIEKTKILGEKGFIFHCDGCPHYAFFQTTDFAEARKMAQEQGWRFKYNAEQDEWSHYCSGECKDK